jgi:hypothetical protein
MIQETKQECDFKQVKGFIIPKTPLVQQKIGILIATCEIN